MCLISAGYLHINTNTPTHSCMRCQDSRYSLFSFINSPYFSEVLLSFYKAFYNLVYYCFFLDVLFFIEAVEASPPLYYCYHLCFCFHPLVGLFVFILEVYPCYYCYCQFFPLMKMAA